jgi:hypothetical protein
MDRLVEQLDETASASGEETYLKSTTVIPLLEACIKVCGWLSLPTRRM